MLATPRSIGYTSQVLQQAQQQASAFQQQLSYAAQGNGQLDEIFLGKTPMLVTVESCLTVILSLTRSDKRNSDAWEQELTQIQAQPFD